jgi:hypothetical protein
VRVGYVPQRPPFIRELPMTVGDFFDLKGHSARTTDEIIRSMDFTGSVLRSPRRRAVFGPISKGAHCLEPLWKP